MSARKALLCAAMPALFLFSHSVAYGQPGGSSMRATIRPGGGPGKCTFEVDVDEIAEVEVRGDTGYLRTIAGAPATWRRLVCNGPLPPNPAGFRFAGVDGRGRQTLVRDPNSSGGSAVVRIEDPKNGREGYTGDIIWNDGPQSNYSGGNPNQSSNGAWNNGRGNSGAGNNNSGWNNGGNGGNNGGGNNGWNNGGWNHSGNGGWDGRGRSISVGDAMNICQNEVASESGSDRDDVRVATDSNNSDRGSYTVNFQIRSRRDRDNRVSGSCRISRNGQIEDIRH